MFLPVLVRRQAPVKPASQKTENSEKEEVMTEDDGAMNS